VLAKIASQKGVVQFLGGGWGCGGGGGGGGWGGGGGGGGVGVGGVRGGGCAPRK